MPACLMALGPAAMPATAAQAAVPRQAGPFWPGNLLSMTNADFENGVGDWVKSSDVKTLTTEDSTVFLHKEALEIVAAGPGASVISLSGANGINIPLPGTGSRTFRVGAYINMQSTNSHTAEFDLQCYDSNGDPVSGGSGTPASITSDGNWHWVEDDITVPSNCSSVHDSPQVRFTNMHVGGTIYMDEAWFAPKRAALMIGAYAQTAADWVNYDTPGNSLYIGPLQSIKIFFGNHTPDLPTRWIGTSSSPNKCYQVEQLLTHSAQWPTCVINLNPVDSSGNPTEYTESRVQAFLAGMPKSQTVIFVYHDEPEGDSFAKCPGSARGNAANFKCYFEEEANSIRTAAANVNPPVTENVFVADDSASFQYGPGGAGYGCGWIVPPSYADFYLVDHYERGWADGHNLSAQRGKGAPQWNNWLNCVDEKGSGKPIGLAEYGLCSGGANCTNGSATCGDAGSTALDKATMSADNTYLASEPSGNSPTVLWEYWYDKCWQFDNTHHEITEWRSIENTNGGAVGG